MKLRHLRRYDVQATYACILALISVVPLGGASLLAWRNYVPELGQILYVSGTPYLPAFLGSLCASGLCSMVAFILGWNSAGQRRNDKPTRSWLGFFIGGGVLTCNLILLIAFWMLRFQRPS